MQAESVAARRFDLICLGRAAVDLYSEQLGCRLEDTASFAKYVGGCAGNIAIGCARQGLRVAMLSRVGDEQMGRFVRETLVAEGVDVSHLSTDDDRMTGLAILGIRDRDTFPLLFLPRELRRHGDFPRGFRPRIHRLGPRPPGYRDAFFHPGYRPGFPHRHFLRPQAWRDGRF